MRLYKWVMWILTLGAVADIWTTLANYYHHDIFNETNPLIILGGVPLWWMIGIKILAVSIILYGCYTYHPKVSPVIRYFFVYMVVLLMFLQIGVSITNYYVLQIPKEEMVEVPQEVKVQYYKESVGDLKALQPTRETPLIAYLIPLNLFQFIAWRSFEKWKMKT